MIRREIALFLCAMQFLTRIPAPPLAGFQPDWIARSARWFPLVGQMVGAVSALALVVAAGPWGPWIAALLAVAAGVALTGAFHEDGLADTADGLGGGQTRARRLEIMKDSRLGTYGAVTLGLALALKVAAIASLTQASLLTAAVAVVAAHGLGRTAAVTAMAVLPYAGDPDLAKEGRPDRPSAVGVFVAVAVGLWPLAGLPPLAGLGATAAGLLVAAIPAGLAWRLLGGRTGDVLGAVEQAFEIGFLLALAAVTA